MLKHMMDKTCCGCGSCAVACRRNAISMMENGEGFRYPFASEELCIHCGKCIQVCPLQRRLPKRHELLRAYACYAKDVRVRKESTSGGIFTIIAQYVLKMLSGKVYGVRYNKDFETEYGCGTDIEDLAAFRGSKYPQAKENNVYDSVKTSLNNGMAVLFSGLPCHIEALRSFLGKDYENLYLMDMVCMGVASPGFWKVHLKKNYPGIEEIRFKDKVNGWKNWKTMVRINGRKRYYTRHEDVYMRGFLEKKNVRLSCYDCQFKGIDRNSDFTIADCWGDGEKSKLNDDGGLSALLLHTKKGLQVFNEVKKFLQYEEFPPDVLMRGNRATCHSVEEPSGRKEFFEKVMM